MSRIIAGRARGSRLRMPQGERTRPTTDRVREAFFSYLATWADGAAAEPEDQLSGVRFLDLYSGSGAMGLEAASRGAAEAVLVESHRPVVELIKRNAAATTLADRATVHPFSVATFLAGEPQPFDVVWLDPPYSMPTDEVSAVLARIAEGWLASDGLVVVERSRRDPPPQWPAPLRVRWSRRYGETELHFGRPAPHDSVRNP